MAEKKAQSEQLLQMLFRVDGLVAVITGGGAGLGRMLARALAVNGANKIYILGRRRDVLQECATSVSTGNIIPLVCDVTSKEDLKATALQISSEVGYINLLCCNAGILGPTSAAIPYMGATLSEFVEGQWDMDHQKCLDVFQTNVTSMWFNVVAFLELLNAGNKKKNVDFSSQIVTMSAAGGFNRQSPGTFIYDQSKAAVIHLAKQLSTSLVPYSIRANVIAPGVFPTDMAGWAMNSGSLEKDKFPAGRYGDEYDMSGAILFLASRAGANVNGMVLLIDGGSVGVVPATY